MTRRRRLKPEEQELWQQVARSTDPLHAGTRHTPVKDGLANDGLGKDGRVTDGPKQRSIAEPQEQPDRISPFEMGARAMPRTQTHVPPKTTSDHLHAAPVRMDAKAFTRLKRGKFVPEARIDLHGMTVDHAHAALNRFILTTQAQGLRLVLVITGKGQRDDPYDPLPQRRGILKTQAPRWMQIPPLSQAILQISEAHRKHGGEGAYYVYLRRRR